MVLLLESPLFTYFFLFSSSFSFCVCCIFPNGHTYSYCIPLVAMARRYITRTIRDRIGLCVCSSAAFDGRKKRHMHCLLGLGLSLTQMHRHRLAYDHHRENNDSAWLESNITYIMNGIHFYTTISHTIEKEKKI